MNYRILVLEIIAIAVAYLVFSMPFAFATEVRMIYGVAEDIVWLDGENIVNKIVSVPMRGESVFVSVGGDNVEKVYVYRCGDKNPRECINIGNYSFSDGEFSETYKFSDISENNVANLLMLVKTRVGGTVGWIGFWQEIVKSGILYTISRELNELNLYTKSIDFGFIENFVTTNQIIPFRSIERAVFVDTEKLYVVSGDMGDFETASFQVTESSARELSQIDKDFFVVFPKISSEGVGDAITLNLNTLYTCGANGCETGLGETSSNCCYDCGCGEGQYCDLDNGCRNPNSISISVSGDTGITNCQIENTIELSVIVNNEPTGMNINWAGYKLNQSLSTTSCIKEGNVYKCPVIVPERPDCDAGSFRIGPNIFYMNISFPDGAGIMEMGLETPFDDIRVTSWNYADGECQRELGENEENSCYDCGCGEGQYCDYNVSNHAEDRCREEPANNDLIVLEANPLSFYRGSSTGTVNLLINIRNKPKTMRFLSGSCLTECRYEDIGCMSTCSLSCTGLPSSDPNIYNATCDLRFNIDSYNSTNIYTLNPSIGINISYINGSAGILEKRLEASTPSISIGLMQCGNMECDEPWETSSNCCYDCGCGEGQYCDTQNRSKFTVGDACRPVSKIGITIESVERQEFVDSSIDHEVNMNISINNLPSGMFLVSSDCEFEDDVYCGVICEESENAKFTCKLTLPSMDYNNSPFFDENKRLIRFPPGNLSFFIRFNNGSQRIGRVIKTALPRFTVRPVPECGANGCEAILGETTETCCIDCLCQNDPRYGEDYFCYTGVEPAGECIKTDRMVMSLRSRKVECTLNVKGECVVSRVVYLNATIVNTPENLRIESASYKIGEERSDARCMLINRTNSSVDITCAILVPNIKDGKKTLDGISRRVNLSVKVGYRQGEVDFTGTVNASAVLRIIGNKSLEYINCKKAAKDVEDAKNRVSAQKNSLNAFLITLGTLTAAACAACASGEGGWMGCKGCKVGGALTSCITSYLLDRYEKAKDEVEKLKNEKRALCMADGIGGIRGSTSSIGGFGFGIGALLKIACLVLGINIMWGLFNSKAEKEGETEVPTTEKKNNIPLSIPNGLDVVA